MMPKTNNHSDKSDSRSFPENDEMSTISIVIKSTSKESKEAVLKILQDLPDRFDVSVKVNDNYIEQKKDGAKGDLAIQIEKLIKSEQRYHSMVSEVEDYAILSLSKEGIIENWNKGAENIKGYKEEEIVGKNFKVFYTKEDQRNKLPEKLLIQAAQSGSARHEGWRVRKDGSKFWGNILITALTNEHNEVIGFFKVTRDLTEIKMTEDKLKEANNQLLTKTNQLIEAQELAHIGSWEWDVETNKIDWSDELYRIFGLNPLEFEADYESYLNYVFPEDRATLEKLVKRALVDGKSYQLHHRIIYSDGSIRIINTTARVYKNEKGKVAKIAGTAQDITLQKNYEAQLKESEEKIFKIFNSNPIPMSLIATATGKISFANNQFYTVFGYDKKEVIGNTSAEMNLVTLEENERIIRVILSSTDDYRTVAEFRALSAKEKEIILNKFKLTDTIKNFEVYYRHKNGTIFPALTSYETIRIKNEKFTITSYIDITNRKKVEEVLREQNNALEKMNKELQSFAYISSHDLQEPLRKIQTFSSRILEKEMANLSDKGKYHFSQMQFAAGRMQQLIQDLLSYSRINDEKPDFEYLNFNELVNDVKDEMSEQFIEKNATIKQDELCHAPVIPFQFRQLLTNLFSNSLKFSRPDIPPIITLHSRIVKGQKLLEYNINHKEWLKNIKTDHNYCHLSVADNGIGFEQEYSNKIFEVFQRLHGKEQYSGTGIGLAIVKKIVDNHQGAITAHSKLGDGAIFDIYFPVE